MSVLAGDTLRLKVQVEQNGTSVSPTAVLWTDDLGDTLGTGAESLARLRHPGRRTVGVSARTGGATALASRVVGVLPNLPPVLTVDSTADSTTHYATETIIAGAAATDPEGQRVTITWTCDSAGLRATGDTLRWTPGASHAGTFRILVVATDPEGIADSASFHVHLLPVAEIAWSNRYGDSWGQDEMLAVGDDGRIYASAEPSTLVAVNPDGSLLWSHQLDGGHADFHGYWSALTITPDNRVFLFANGSSPKGLGPDGSLLWQAPLSQGGQVPKGIRFALGTDGSLYVGVLPPWGGVVAKLDPSSGSLLWSDTLSWTFLQAPILSQDNSRIRFAGNDLSITTIDGAIVDSAVGSAHFTFRAAGDAAGNVYTISPDTALDLAGSVGYAALYKMGANGQVRWMHSLSPSPYTSGWGSEPTVAADTTVYAANWDGGETFVFAVGAGGTEHWRRILDGGSEDVGPRVALLADGTMWVTAGYAIYRLRMATGAVVQIVPLRAEITSSPAVAPDGTLYVITNDGSLVAIKGGAPLAPDAPWPTFRADSRRTSRVHS